MIPTDSTVPRRRVLLIFGYTVMTRPDLTPGSWDPLISGSFSDAGDQRTVTDPAASETRKFHTVEIVKP